MQILNQIHWWYNEYRPGTANRRVWNWTFPPHVPGRSLLALYKWQDEPKKSICGVFVKGWVQCSQVDKYPSFVFVMFFIYNYKFVYLSVYLYCICKEYVEERLSRQLSLI